MCNVGWLQSKEMISLEKRVFYFYIYIIMYMNMMYNGK